MNEVAEEFIRKNIEEVRQWLSSPQCLLFSTAHTGVIVTNELAFDIFRVGQLGAATLHNLCALQAENRKFQSVDELLVHFDMVRQNHEAMRQEMMSLFMRLPHSFYDVVEEKRALEWLSLCSATRLPSYLRYFQRFVDGKKQFDSLDNLVQALLLETWKEQKMNPPQLLAHNDAPYFPSQENFNLLATSQMTDTKNDGRGIEYGEPQNEQQRLATSSPLRLQYQQQQQQPQPQQRMQQQPSPSLGQSVYRYSRPARVSSPQNNASTFNNYNYPAYNDSSSSSHQTNRFQSLPRLRIGQGLEPPSSFSSFAQTPAPSSGWRGGGSESNNNNSNNNSNRGGRMQQSPAFDSNMVGGASEKMHPQQRPGQAREEGFQSQLVSMGVQEKKVEALIGALRDRLAPSLEADISWARTLNRFELEMQHELSSQLREFGEIPTASPYINYKYNNNNDNNYHNSGDSTTSGDGFRYALSEPAGYPSQQQQQCVSCQSPRAGGGRGGGQQHLYSPPWERGASPTRALEANSPYRPAHMSAGQQRRPQSPYVPLYEEMGGGGGGGGRGQEEEPAGYDLVGGGGGMIDEGRHIDEDDRYDYQLIRVTASPLNVRGQHGPKVGRGREGTTHNNDGSIVDFFDAIRENCLTAQLADALLREGVDINSGHGVTTSTPLHWACLLGKHDLVSLLVDRGATVDSTERKCGRTPLMACVVRDDHVCARLLLERGADVSVTDASGVSAVVLAIQRKPPASQCIELFLEWGAEVAASPTTVHNHQKQQLQQQGQRQQRREQKQAIVPPPQPAFLDTGSPTIGRTSGGKSKEEMNYRPPTSSTATEQTVLDKGKGSEATVWFERTSASPPPPQVDPAWADAEEESLVNRTQNAAAFGEGYQAPVTLGPVIDRLFSNPTSTMDTEATALSTTPTPTPTTATATATATASPPTITTSTNSATFASTQAHLTVEVIEEEEEEDGTDEVDVSVKAQSQVKTRARTDTPTPSHLSFTPVPSVSGRPASSSKPLAKDNQKTTSSVDADIARKVTELTDAKMKDLEVVVEDELHEVHEL